MLPARPVVSGNAIYRSVLHGLLKFLVLHMADEGPVHGWALRNALNAVGCHISSGTLYPLLRGMESSGLLRSRVRSAGKRTVREYELTADGRQQLAALRRDLLRLASAVGLYPELVRGGDSVVRPRRWARGAATDS